MFFWKFLPKKQIGKANGYLLFVCVSSLCRCYYYSVLVDIFSLCVYFVNNAFVFSLLYFDFKLLAALLNENNIQLFPSALSTLLSLLPLLAVAASSTIQNHDKWQWRQLLIYTYGNTIIGDYLLLVVIAGNFRTINVDNLRTTTKLINGWFLAVTGYGWWWWFWL